jgi:hypothetical protein
MADRSLLYRAGHHAFKRIRSDGFDPSMIAAFAGPASGPKWLVLAGIDRVLIASGLLTRSGGGSGRRVLLVGASAGAWRALCLASRDPVAVHRRFEDGYVGQQFPRGVTARQISDAYRRMLRELFPLDEVQHLLAQPDFDVALHAVRARGPAGSSNRRLQGAAMIAAAVLNLLSARTVALWFDRVLFHSCPERWQLPFHGTVAALTEENFHGAALATGTVPLYMEPVEAVPGVAPGRHLDGGLTDYHVNQRYLEGDDGIVLFPHFQERIAANWFDRYLPWRRPVDEVLSDVLQVYPSPAFLADLPDGRIPTRDDFIEFVDQPELRIRRWRKASAASDALGEQLLDDLEHGRIPDLLQPI